MESSLPIVLSLRQKFRRTKSGLSSGQSL